MWVFVFGDLVMKRVFTMVPLLGVPVIIYNLIVLSVADPTPAIPMPIDNTLSAVLFEMGMISGGVWSFRLSDLVLLSAFVALFFELVKATNTRGSSLANHGFSIGLLMFCIVEFLLFRSFATSLFFLLMLASLLDVIAGFMITVTAARRDIGVGEGFVR